jgi:hypothetical protein
MKNGLTDACPLRLCALILLLVGLLAPSTEALYLLRKRYEISVLAEMSLTWTRLFSATVCNGRSELCDRRYGNTTFLTAHNSFAFSSNPLAREAVPSCSQSLGKPNVQNSRPEPSCRYSVSNEHRCSSPPRPSTHGERKVAFLPHECVLPLLRFKDCTLISVPRLRAYLCM